MTSTPAEIRANAQKAKRYDHLNTPETKASLARRQEATRAERNLRAQAEMDTDHERAFSEAKTIADKIIKAAEKANGQ